MAFSRGAVNTIKKEVHTSSSSTETVFLIDAELGEVISIPSYVFTDDISQYAEYVGHGSFGTVFKYPPDEISSGTTVALKQIYFGLSSSKTIRDDVIKEVETHRNLIHPNIVKYIGSHETEKAIYIVMEYLPQESLHHNLKSIEDPSTPALAEETIFRYTEQILSGLVFLHSYNRDPSDQTQRAPVIHRDLRSANIMIDAFGNLKLADFGISKQLDILASRSQFHTADIGNYYWRSPEMISEVKEKIGRKVDVWSLGITILEMIFVDIPFMNLTILGYIRLIVNRHEFENLLGSHKGEINSTTMLSDLIDKCLTYDADARPTSLELLQSLWTVKDTASSPPLNGEVARGWLGPWGKNRPPRIKTF